jgi:photosystem II stability/assembly factor-like uncharacterized protein
LVATLAGCTSSASRPTPSTAVRSTSTPLTDSHPRASWTAVTGASGTLWLLGEYLCSKGTCFAIMRSINAGSTFVRVGAPLAFLPPKKDETTGTYGASFQFANAKDGYFYSFSPRARLYWTRDGGNTWRLVQPGGSLVWRDSGLNGPLASGIVTTDGRAYTLISEDCSHGYYCKSLDLATSAVTSDTWTTVPLPVAAFNKSITMTALGREVWLVVTQGGGGNARLLVSDDGGRRFSNLPSTGMIGLICRATPTSTTTLWGFCDTGMEGYETRSTDGGRDWRMIWRS